MGLNQVKIITINITTLITIGFIKIKVVTITSLIMSITIGIFMLKYSVLFMTEWYSH